MPWHAMDGAQVLESLHTEDSGLATSEAERRLARDGYNTIPRAGGESALRIAWRQLDSPLIWVLLASGGLAIALGKTVDGAVVLGVVVANGLIGFVQELRAGKAIAALRDLVPETAAVARDGHFSQVPAHRVVPGDIVPIVPGDRVPADLRLLTCRALRADESALTGESTPADKRASAVPAEAPVADRASMLHGGTVVAAGRGTAVVVRTGTDTELGRISSLLRETTELATPLTRSMAHVARRLSTVISAIALMLAAIGLARGYPLVDAVLAAISLAVAAIPEGVPAIITIALAIGVRRMARRRAIVRRLPAVEALGSTTVVCTDKTGTLTRNEMTVTALWTPLGNYEVEFPPGGGPAIARSGEVLEGPPPDLERLLVAGAVCNDAAPAANDGGRFTGDATETALLEAAGAAGIDVREVRATRPRRSEIPFDSERRYMATLNEVPSGSRELLVKGAPETILERCTTAAGERIDRPKVRAAVDALAARGMRVLAFATAQEDAEDLGDTLSGGTLDLVGLQALIDPPRPEAIAAVADCQSAGIAVKMITGDHGATATAIGRQLNLDSGHVLTGGDLDELSDAELRRAASQVSVFARVAPEHKLRLVQALQADGEVVGMTGDGVNDAPALRKAEVGVAMGASGTAVSREAADIVLTDDNFSTIRAAVEEGRRVFDNIVKALAFALPTNIGEGLIILVAVLFFPIAEGEPLLPVEPVQILWINLVATVSLALPLAFEAIEPGIMSRPPRRPGTPVLNRLVSIRTVYVAVLMTAAAVVLFLLAYHSELAGGASRADAVATAQTQAVTMIVFFQILYLMTCRSLTGSLRDVGVASNPTIFAGVAALLGLQLGFVYLPVMNELFHSTALDLAEWGQAALAALPVLPIVAAEKRFRRGRQTSQVMKADG